MIELEIINKQIAFVITLLGCLLNSNCIEDDLLAANSTSFYIYQSEETTEVLSDAFDVSDHLKLN